LLDGKSRLRKSSQDPNTPTSLSFPEKSSGPPPPPLPPPLRHSNPETVMHNSKMKHIDKRSTKVTSSSPRHLKIIVF